MVLTMTGEASRRAGRIRVCAAVWHGKICHGALIEVSEAAVQFTTFGRTVARGFGCPRCTAMYESTHFISREDWREVGEEYKFRRLW